MLGEEFMTDTLYFVVVGISLFRRRDGFIVTPGDTVNLAVKVPFTEQELDRAYHRALTQS